MLSWTFFSVIIIFIFSQFDWICCDWTEGVCMCVCMYVCVCVCGSSPAQTDGSILMKFSTNDLTDICEVRFSRILKIRNDDVMAAILLAFLCGTLTVVILIWFSSNWRRGRKLSSVVCYWKLAFSVSNFGQYGGLCFQKKLPPND